MGSAAATGGHQPSRIDDITDRGRLVGETWADHGKNRRVGDDLPCNGSGLRSALGVELLRRQWAPRVRRDELINGDLGTVPEGSRETGLFAGENAHEGD